MVNVSTTFSVRVRVGLSVRARVGVWAHSRSHLGRKTVFETPYHTENLCTLRPEQGTGRVWVRVRVGEGARCILYQLKHFVAVWDIR